MLEQIFGSRTRVKLLRIFLTNPETDYFVRELTRKIRERINSVRRELDNLEEIGLITTHEGKLRKYYRVDQNFILFPELRSLILKSQMTVERNLGKRIQQVGQVSYLALTGIFTGVSDTPTDILIVGKVNRLKLKRLVSNFQKDLDKKIRYTVMTRQEFEYRNDLTDKFLYTILENKKIVITDKIFSK
ncbi:MAG: winged helix-turn-helix domain-containing protein [Patescibacteria group bacterium]|nr:winged helix-turn-helix domain-containing protein [Patescibacteria group bacterium]